MEISLWQITILTLFTFIAQIDNLALSIGLGRPLIAGTITGLIMGDIQAGMAVGATLELMILGVGTYGGASIPDYMTGAIIGTVFAVISGEGLEFGIGLAVPVGLLMVQLDILARFLNVFFQNRIESAIDRMDFKSVSTNTWLGALPWGLSRAIPVFLILFFGQNIVNTLLDYAPDWLMGGLSVAGGLLPAVGLAILLRYLPTMDNVQYLIIGFFLAAYLEVPMIGVALIGLAMAIITYRGHSMKVSDAINTLNEGGILDGEYED
ncbi:PTS sugar transporter subunit IIC [Carnobacteriaceae bacterium 52-44]